MTLAETLLLVGFETFLTAMTAKRTQLSPKQGFLRDVNYLCVL